MINLGSTSIADVKFGSQQISKAYFGSDLVWEKDDEMFELRIGRYGLPAAVFFSSDYEYPYTASGYGFSISSSERSHGRGYSVREVFDKSSETGFACYSTTSSQTQYITITFPFSVNILKTVEESGSAVDSFYVFQTGLQVKYYYSGYKNPYAAAVQCSKDDSSYVTIGDTVNISTNEGSLSRIPVTGDDSALKNVRSIRFILTYPSDNKKMRLGDCGMAVEVKKSVYDKWKADYNLTTNPNIP